MDSNNNGWNIFNSEIPFKCLVWWMIKFIGAYTLIAAILGCILIVFFALVATFSGVKPPTISSPSDLLLFGTPAPNNSKTLPYIPTK